MHDGPGQDADPAAAEADLLFALVRGRYGDRLTAEQLEAVRQGVRVIVGEARALRAVPLRNADGPDLPALPAGPGASGARTPPDPAPA